MKYIDAIARGFPGVQCHSVGVDDAYESLVWDAGNPIPSKGTLDEYIAANGANANIVSRVTVLGFRNRFTLNEKVATELAAADNPSATMQQRQLSASVRVLLRDLETSTFVDLQRADLRQGVTMLEQYGLIGQGRALQILDAPITEIERSPI